MILQIGDLSCRHVRWWSLRMAIVAMVFPMLGCTELDLGAQTGNGDSGVEKQAPTPPVLPSSTRQDSIDPSMRLDPEAFHVTGLGLWDGERTLPGVWIAYPMAEVARRVRLTNVETGARADAAMFRRDTNLTGPRIIVSSEAAEWLGLTPGHATPVTIDGLTYRTAAESANVVTTAAEEPEPAPVDVPAEGPAADPAADPAPPGEPPLAIVSADPRTVLKPAAAGTGAPDAAALEDDTGSEPAPNAVLTGAAGESVGSDVIIPIPRPAEMSTDPAPDVSGQITDGRHFIQAGIFGQPENAARLMEKLRAANLPVDELPLILSGRPLTRVLIGPYQNIAERNIALEMVRRLGPTDATLIRAPIQAPT